MVEAPDTQTSLDPAAVTAGSRHADAPRNALVTGAAGFIGSHVVDALLARGWRVKGLDRRSPSTDAEAARNLDAALRQKRFHFEHADVCGPRTRELLDGVDVVFHLAAATGVRRSWGKAFPDYVHDNIATTHHLMEECDRAGTARVVVASSSSVYGGAPTPCREAGPVLPISPYGVSKLAAEQMALAYAARETAPTSVVALRYFTVYGPRQRGDMAISRMFRAVLTGQPLRIYGDGQQRRAFTFVSDVVQATIQAAVTGETGQAVNVAGPRSETVRTLLDAVQDVTGSAVPHTVVGPCAGDPDATEADSSLAEDVLGFRPCVGLRDGLGRQWAWESAQRAGLVGGAA